MKYKLFFTGIFIVQSLLSVGQSFWTAEEYFGIPQTSFENFFFDNFNDNRNNWLEEKIPDSHLFQNGYLFFNSPFHTPYLTGINVNFDETQDFQIETSIQFISGKIDEFIGIFWGILVFSETYKFGFSANGKHKIFKDYSTSQEIIQDWTLSGLVNPKSTNKLTIRKVNNQYYFFINEKLVHSSIYFPLPGFDFGFEAAQQTTIKVDFLKLDYIR